MKMTKVFNFFIKDIINGYVRVGKNTINFKIIYGI
jgi:hypothetical protein